jgi:hypothetical protein
VQRRKGRSWGGGWSKSGGGWQLGSRAAGKQQGRRPTMPMRDSLPQALSLSSSLPLPHHADAAAKGVAAEGGAVLARLDGQDDLVRREHARHRVGAARERLPAAAAGAVKSHPSARRVRFRFLRRLGWNPGAIGARARCSGEARAREDADWLGESRVGQRDRPATI